VTYVDETQGAAVVNGDAMPDAPWTEDQVLGALYRRFAPDGWAPVAQVTAHDDEGVTGDTALHRRVDLLMARRDLRTRTTLELLAIEVKTNRYDFSRDLADPHKQSLWKSIATRHAYAAPAGVIMSAEVPEGSGLLEVDRLVRHRADSPTTVDWVLTAPAAVGEVGHLPFTVQLTLLHRLAEAEASLRGWEAPSAATNERDLRGQISALRKELDKAYRDRDNANGKAEAWKQAYSMAAGDGLPCAFCHMPLRPLRPGKGWFSEWKHLTAADTEACTLIERTDREDIARTTWVEATEAERDAAMRRARVRSTYQDELANLDAEPWRAFLVPRRDPTPEAR